LGIADRTEEVMMNLEARMRAAWIALPLALSMAGCATMHTGLSNSAQRMERSSELMERNADDRGIREDARQLSAETRDFRETVADSQADRDDIRGAFDDLSRSYHSLRDEVEKSQDRESERDFDAVTSAYLDIEREINRSDRYARD
jgi:uncharacterized coiled-coil DUF342 family protein